MWSLVNCPEKFLTALRLFCNGVPGKVRIVCGLSKHFHVTNGVKKKGMDKCTLEGFSKEERKLLL